MPIATKAQQSAPQAAEDYWHDLDSLARQHYGLNQLDSSLYCFSLMEEWALQHPDIKWRRKVWRRRADLLYRAEQYLNAIPDYERAIEIYAAEERYLRLSKSRRRLAYSLRKTGNITQARTQYLLSIEAAQLAGSAGSLFMADAYNSLGNMYLNLAEFTLAEDNYLKALNTYEEFQHEVGIAATYNNLALVFSRSGQYEKARPYLERSLELKIARNDQQGIANTYANLGDIAFEQEDYSTAEGYHRQSIRIRDSIGLLEDITQSYTRMGQIALAKNQGQEALDWCALSRDIADPGQYWEARIACHRCLYEAYKQLGQWEASLIEYETFKAIQDSIDRLNNFQELELNSAKEQLEQEILQAKKSQWLLLALLLFSILLSFLLWKRQTKQTVVEPAPGIAPTPQQRAAEQTPAPIAESNDSWLQDLQVHIENMIDARQTITTGILAETNHLSERQLLRRIREQTGLTTKQFIQDVKLQTARKWLENRRYSKSKDVAKALGFKSTQYFSKLFKDRFGKSPASYLP